MTAREAGGIDQVEAGHDVGPRPRGDRLDRLGERLGAQHGDGEDRRLQPPALHHQDGDGHQADQGKDGEAAKRGDVAGAFLQPAGSGGQRRMAWRAQRQQHRPVEAAGVPVLHGVPERAEAPDRRCDRDRREQQAPFDPADGDDHLGGERGMRERLDHGR